MQLLPPSLHLGNPAGEPGIIQPTEPPFTESISSSEMGRNHRGFSKDPSHGNRFTKQNLVHRCSSRSVFSAVLATVPALSSIQWGGVEGGLSPSRDWCEGRN